MGDAVFAYLYWVWAKRPYDVAGLQKFFSERAEKKLQKKNRIDFDDYQQTLQAISVLKMRLKQIE